MSVNSSENASEGSGPDLGTFPTHSIRLSKILTTFDMRTKRMKRFQKNRKYSDKVVSAVIYVIMFE